MPREQAIKIRSDRALRLRPYIVLKIRGKRYKFDIRREIRLAQSTAEDALVYHAERFVFWRRMLAERTRERRRVEAKLASTKEALYLQFRAAVKDGQFDKMTEREISAEIALNARVVRLQERLQLALYREDICRTMVEAFDHRKGAFAKLFRRPSPER